MDGDGVDGAAPDEVIEATERWFLDRGLPHFAVDYRAREDIFTRAASPLGLLFLFEVLGALNLDWVWWANLAAVAAAAAALLGAWTLLNRLRGRPRWARPETVGVPELAVFVVVPALLPLVFGGQVVSAAVTLAVNLAILGVVYLATSYALVPMTRWAATTSVAQLGNVLGLFARTLPLFLVFATFVFINAEMWQVADGFSAWTFAATIAVLLLVGTTFVVVQAPREIAAVTDVDPDDVPDLCHDSPLARRARPATGPPLRRRERGNVMLVYVVAQGVQVVAVSAAIGVFFVVFGVLTVTPEVEAAWTGGAADALVTADVGGRTLAISPTLLHVAGFLAAFAGLYFTVQAATDATYREEVLGAVTTELREAAAVRAAYRDLLTTGPGRSPTS